jgi:fibronectin type III domain protein
MKTLRVVGIFAAALAVLLAAGPSAIARTGADTTSPTAPGNLHALSVSDTDIVLAWDPSTDNSGSVNYAVFFDANPTPLLTSADTQFDVHLNRAIGMTPGSSHTFQVRAEDPSGNRSFSNELTVSFAAGDNTPPTAPGNLRVVSNTPSGVELAWDPSTDESDFDYHVAGTPCSPMVVAGDTTHVLVPSVDSDPVCGLVRGSTFTFSVWARDALNNDSALSNSVTVTFAPNK